MVKKNNEASQNIVEALHRLTDLHEKLLESNQQLLEKIDQISHIEIPPPVVHMVPPRQVNRRVVRDKAGMIERIIEEDIDEGDDI